MSPEIVNGCLKYSYDHNYPLMIIASRNQVDYQSGYAFATSELSSFIKTNKYYDKDRIKICRDHCGPNFSDKDKNLSLHEIIEICKKTIETDIQNGFELIHIDVSRVNTKIQEELSINLIEYALSLNPNLALEFGCEDNTGNNLHDTLETVDKQIEFALKYKNNIKYLVNQTGSLTKQTQVGIFNQELSNKIAIKIHNAGFYFKEHNADYLTKSQVNQRKLAGINAINIAPQLGYIHSLTLNKLGYNYASVLDEFKQYVLKQGYWKKWVVDGIDDPEIKFLASAHYFLNSKYAILIREVISSKNLSFDELLYQELSIVLDQYRLGFSE